MRILELFSGTGPVGNVCKELGFEVVSLGRDMEADIRAYVMDWDYKTYPPKHFDFIWASPPCTEYRAAKTIGTRDIEGSNRVVARTIEIIRYFDPPILGDGEPPDGQAQAARGGAPTRLQRCGLLQIRLPLQKAGQAMEQHWVLVASPRV